MRALQEYTKKHGISTLWLANLYKAHAVLCLASKEFKDVNESLKSIKIANKLFLQIPLKKGVAISKYFISSALYHDFWSELKGVSVPFKNNFHGLYRRKQKEKCLKVLFISDKHHWKFLSK